MSKRNFFVIIVMIILIIVIICVNANRNKSNNGTASIKNYNTNIDVVNTENGLYTIVDENNEVLMQNVTEEDIIIYQENPYYNPDPVYQ